MTTGKIIALTRQTFVSKLMTLLFHILSRLVIAFLWTKSLWRLLSKSLLISWLQSLSAVILTQLNTQHSKNRCPCLILLLGIKHSIFTINCEGRFSYLLMSFIMLRIFLLYLISREFLSWMDNEFYPSVLSWLGVFISFNI